MQFSKIIFVESDLGSPQSGTDLGPRALAYALEKYRAQQVVADAVIRAPQSSRLSKNYTPYSDSTALLHVIKDVKDVVARHLSSDNILVFSGDHSTACGTLAGMARAYPDTHIGVIWLDAHADLHSPYTTPTGNIHGMPLAAAMALDHISHKHNSNSDAVYFWETLKSICQQALKPEHLVYIGTRDIEPEESEAIDTHNILCISANEVQRSGVQTTLHAVFEQLASCDYIYVSLDVDVLNPSLIPGTGTPVSGGLDIHLIRELLQEILTDPRVKLFEIAEINPLLDSKNQSSECIARLIHELLPSSGIIKS